MCFQPYTLKQDLPNLPGPPGGGLTLDKNPSHVKRTSPEDIQQISDKSRWGDRKRSIRSSFDRPPKHEDDFSKVINAKPVKKMNFICRENPGHHANLVTQVAPFQKENLCGHCHVLSRCLQPKIRDGYFRPRNCESAILVLCAKETGPFSGPRRRVP